VKTPREVAHDSNHVRLSGGCAGELDDDRPWNHRGVCNVLTEAIAARDAAHEAAREELVRACEQALKSEAIECFCEGDEGEIGEHEETCHQWQVYRAVEAIRRGPR